MAWQLKLVDGTVFAGQVRQAFDGVIGIEVEQIADEQMSWRMGDGLEIGGSRHAGYPLSTFGRTDRGSLMQPSCGFRSCGVRAGAARHVA